MKLRFKHQKFQADAAKAVCDVFAGQPKLEHTYIIDPGLITKPEQIGMDFDATPEEVKRRIEQLNTGHNNAKVLLSADQILENLQRVQRSNQLPPSPKLEGCTISQSRWRLCRQDLYLH